MKIKKILINCVIGLTILLGISSISPMAKVSANQPQTITKYTNGKYKYFYPYNNHRAIESSAKITSHRHMLPRNIRYNAQAKLISPFFKASRVYFHHQTYYLAYYFPDTQTNLMGYINAKDFSNHKLNSHKAKIRKINYHHNKRIINRIHKLQAEIHNLRKQLRY